ncbi:MAG: element excision factor XisH family protein [Meiothermus sp.]|nr:element excision factor XisH family protein [Meiothermus sp.]
MPAKDAHHDGVRRALEKGGWRITHDPLYLTYGRRDVFVDLGAEVIAAETNDVRIAVEVKSFFGKSEMTELERALGQIMLYRNMLRESQPERLLYLAVPQPIMVRLFEDDLGQLLIRNEALRVLSYDPALEEVVKWLPIPY